MKILIADDHALFLDGLRMQIEQLYPHAAIFEAKDHQQAFDFVSKNTDLDYVLLDLTMPGMAWDEAMTCITSKLENGRLVVLSGSEEVDDVRKALEFGVAGFIPKRSDTHILVNALRLVLDGGTYLPPILLKGDSPVAPAPTKKKAPVNGKAIKKHTEKIDRFMIPGGGRLTKRQREVLDFLGVGMSNKIIAHELGVSEATVKLHINALLRNLSVTNRTQAVIRAQEIGLL